MKLFCNKFSIKAFILLLLISGIISAQNLQLPRISPAAKVSQKISLSETAFEYSRPQVNNRVILGGLVPYNSVWRAGANENTTFYVSTDAKINGNPIPAGKYGFHIIPRKDEWTLVFSKHNNSWGSFFYDKSADQLRINVIPKENEFVEILTYGFDHLTENSATAFLKWEKIRVDFKIEFDAIGITLESIREQLRSIPGFGAQGPKQAAEYCLTHNINLEEALEWINISLSREESFKSYYTKALILEKLEKFDEIKNMSKDLLKYEDSLDEYQRNNLAHIFLLSDQLKEAKKIYKRNISDNKQCWQSYEGLGDIYRKQNEFGEAISYYEKGIENCSDSDKQRILKKIEKIKNK